MPIEVKITPKCIVRVYSQHEAKRLGLIDSWEREGTHAEVTTPFSLPEEGELLNSTISLMFDEVLIGSAEKVSVYRPKAVIKSESEEA